MPEVSGLDMLEFVRRRKEWNDLPILMLSTEAADVTVDKALTLGADGYVSKPVTIEELEKAINDSLPETSERFVIKMARGKSQSKKVNRPSISQIIFVVLTRDDRSFICFIALREVIIQTSIHFRDRE